MIKIFAFHNADLKLSVLVSCLDHKRDKRTCSASNVLENCSTQIKFVLLTKNSFKKRSKRAKCQRELLKVWSGLWANVKIYIPVCQTLLFIFLTSLFIGNEIGSGWAEALSVLLFAERAGGWELRPNSLTRRVAQPEKSDMSFSKMPSWSSLGSWEWSVFSGNFWISVEWISVQDQIRLRVIKNTIQQFSTVIADSWKTFLNYFKFRRIKQPIYFLHGSTHSIW